MARGVRARALVSREGLRAHPAGVHPDTLTVDGTTRAPDPAELRFHSPAVPIPTQRPAGAGYALAPEPVGRETRPPAHRLGFWQHAEQPLRDNLTGAHVALGRPLYTSGTPRAQEPHGSSPVRPHPRDRPGGWLPGEPESCAPSSRGRITGRTKLYEPRNSAGLRTTADNVNLARRSELP